VQIRRSNAALLSFPVTWRVKTQRLFFFERARKKGAATAPFVSARAFC
jgi:hypothetical protein